MNDNSQQGRFRKVLVIDDDETDIYITTRIIKTTSFANEIFSTSSVNEAMDYLKKNTSADSFPELIFLGMNVIRLNGIDFMNQFSKFIEYEKSNCKIVLMMNVIGMEKADIKKVRANPLIKFVIEKPLTSETLAGIS